MSTAVFPSLPGLQFPVSRTEQWNNTKQESVSGKRGAIANWTYPRHKWTLQYEFLRSGTEAEWQSIISFFNLRKGMFDTFLFEDPNDKSVTGQQIGTGNGTALTFQLIRALASFTEPIFAPHVVSKVYVDGVDKAGHWTVSNWGTDTPGVITFDASPANGKAVTADFTYYFPVRFDDDILDIANFMQGLFSVDGISFSSEK